MSTRAAKYAEACRKTENVPNGDLDERWSARISPEGGLWIYCDKISKGKLSAEAAKALYQFIKENWLQIGTMLVYEKAHSVYICK